MTIGISRRENPGRLQDQEGVRSAFAFRVFGIYQVES